METKSYISIEERAEGKSNLFKFISLRSPNSVSEENRGKFFSYHPNPESSVFLEDIDDINKFGDYQILTTIANNFDYLKSVDDLKNISPELFKFSDWLQRNKNSLDLEKLTVNRQQKVD